MKFYSFSIAVAFFVTVASVVVAQSLDVPMQQVSDSVIEPVLERSFVDSDSFSEVIGVEVSSLLASTTVLSLNEAVLSGIQTDQHKELIGRLDTIIELLTFLVKK